MVLIGIVNEAYVYSCMATIYNINGPSRHCDGTKLEKGDQCLTATAFTFKDTISSSWNLEKALRVYLISARNPLVFAVQLVVIFCQRKSCLVYRQVMPIWRASHEQNLTSTIEEQNITGAKADRDVCWSQTLMYNRRYENIAFQQVCALCKSKKLMHISLLIACYVEHFEMWYPQICCNQNSCRISFSRMPKKPWKMCHLLRHTLYGGSSTRQVNSNPLESVHIAGSCQKVSINKTAINCI